MRNKWVYPIFILVFTLISAEVLLRAFKKNETWSESVGQGYISGYNQKLPNWFYSWGPNRQFELDQKDFKFNYRTNQLGIRERDTFYTDSAAVRILCLGDSYTEGVGAPYDSSYPKLMEQALNQAGFHAQLYNAGIAGSDPFYSYQLFKEKLLAANPQYVFITFNSSDLSDFAFRGGLDRFKSDGTVKCRPGPWYEPLYRYSYVVRFFINNLLRKAWRNLFLSQREYENISCPVAVAQTVDVFDSLNKSGQENGFQLLVVIQPISDELVYKCRENDFTRAMFIALQDSLNNRSIKNIDMWRVLEGKITKANKNIMAHPTDRHYTPAGYSLFANNLLKAIDEKYPDYWK